MSMNDPWLPALRQQAAVVQSARRDLDQARADDWNVVRAEVTLESVEASYHRLLTDAPRASVVRHLRERIKAVRP